MHLIFLIHGLFGNAGHLHSMEKALNEALADQDASVYVGKANSALGTFDGIVEGAHRYYEELNEVIADSKEQVTHISIVGYSLGGLIGRYVVGMLEEDGRIGSDNSSNMEPVVFATFASPHLGNRFHGDGILPRVLNFAGSKLFGRTGRDLFGKNAVLEDMAEPSKPFYRGLSRFHTLLLFANTKNDRTVPFWTSYITSKNPFAGKVKIIADPDNGIVDFEETLKINDPKASKKVSAAHPPKTMEQKARIALVVVLIPVFVLIALSVLAFATLRSWVYELIFGFKPSYGQGDSVKERLLEAGEDLIGDGPEDVSDEPALFNDTVQIDMLPTTRAQLQSLNKLSWKKFPVWFNEPHTHAEIIDRRRANRYGGNGLMQYFASTVRDQHLKISTSRSVSSE